MFFWFSVVEVGTKNEQTSIGKSCPRRDVSLCDPKTFQAGTKTPQDAPKTPQDGPRTPPRLPQDTPGQHFKLSFRWFFWCFFVEFWIIFQLQNLGNPAWLPWKFFSLFYMRVLCEACFQRTLGAAWRRWRPTQVSRSFRDASRSQNTPAWSCNLGWILQVVGSIWKPSWLYIGTRWHHKSMKAIQKSIVRCIPSRTPFLDWFW